MVLVVAALFLSGCPVPCDTACKEVLQRCAVTCTSLITTAAGYGGAVKYCEDNPEYSACGNLPK